MKDTYKDLIVSSRGRLLKIAHESLDEFADKDGGWYRMFMRGMLAGLKFARNELYWLHREIRIKEDQGYTLVWLNEAERDILDQYNP